jgi:DNA topoisomerase I
MQAVPLTRIESNKIHDDYKRTAERASLLYVSDQTPGITRRRSGRGFSYYYRHAPIHDKDVLARIRKLAIPPAWTSVWICSKENGHIQATGKDVRNRKQYRYHTQWNEIRNQTKFHRLYEFGRSLPTLRERVERDICLPSLSKEKVVATVVSLMERTFIRIGNSEYEKLYGSYGLTTLKDGHVRIEGPVMKFSFRGKKGIFHSVTLKNKRLAKIVKACRDIPGKELFQYLDDEGVRCSIDSGMINNYIREATGKDFSAKDFRTWAGTLSMLGSFTALGEATVQADVKKNVILALDEVSAKLGNTRTVCRKYYVHPGLISLYEESSLTRYLKSLEDIEKCDDDGQAGLTGEEKVLMKILQSM